MKLFPKKMAIVVMSVFAFGQISATQYCHEKLTNGSNSVYLSCTSPSAGLYVILIESDVEMQGLGGSFFHLGSVMGQDMRNYMEKSADGKKITISAPSDAAPEMYTPLYVLMPGEVSFEWPANIEWGTCSSGSGDDQKPVITAASVSEVTHNSAVIAVTASDNVGITSFLIKNGTQTLKSASQSPFTLSGLASNTTYNLTIVATDAAGNASDPFALQAFTTEELHYCSFPTGMNQDPNWGDPNGQILLTIDKLSGNSVSVLIQPANNGTVIDYFEVWPNNVAADAPHVGTAGSEQPISTPVILTGLASLDFSLTIQWHTKGMDAAGRWTTGAMTIHEAELCTANNTSLENTEKDTRKAVKVIENGQLVIIHNGVRYNALGAQMQ